jgi:tetratricopeptide (TPR) repeat protein
MAQDPYRQAVAHFNRGCLLQGQQDWEAAISCYEQALALDPNLVAAHSNRGAALAAMNRCEEALASLDRAISLQPDYPEAHFSRAVTLLMQGNLPAGWVDFEWRWKTAPGRALRQSKNFPQPPWLGAQAVEGRTLLLYCERGLGDTLQFCRYALNVAQLHAKVILQVQAPLVQLLGRLCAAVQVVSETQAPPHFDLQCPLLSLPLIFKTTLLTVPAPRRYLSADAGKVSRLLTELGKPSRPRVGLVWRGDAKNPDDRNRSVALSDLLQSLPPELQYFSLQKQTTPQERRLIEDHPHVSIVGEELDFEETAALCELLDLVISIDTSVAHLAAALGRRTWILLPFNPDCRWLLDREDSPWYPSVKLCRQNRSGDWHDVLARVGAELRRLPRGSRHLPRGSGFTT